MLKKNILGLSHILCETNSEYDWTLTLDVPEEKKCILNNTGAESESLYLTSQMGYPIEFIKHNPQKLLTQMGYQLQAGSVYKTKYWGAGNSIARDPKAGINYGAPDVRRSAGSAVGY